jgi:hypothetical protein
MKNKKSKKISSILAGRFDGGCFFICDAGVYADIRRRTFI